MLDVMAHALEVAVNLVECAIAFGNESQAWAVVVGDEFIDDGCGVVGDAHKHQLLALVAVGAGHAVGFGVALDEAVGAIGIEAVAVDDQYIVGGDAGICGEHALVGVGLQLIDSRVILQICFIGVALIGDGRVLDFLVAT